MQIKNDSGVAAADVVRWMDNEDTFSTFSGWEQQMGIFSGQENVQPFFMFEFFLTIVQCN